MDESFGIRDIIVAFFRQFKIFFLVFLCTISFGILSIILAVPMYQTSGSVLVKFGSDADARVNNPTGNQQISTIDRREIMQSNLDILQSHDLLKLVMEKVGIDRIYPGITDSVGSTDSPVEVAIQRMQRKHLTIKSSQQSNVIDINVLNQDPVIAKEVVQEIQNIFIARQLEIFNKPQTNFLQLQVKESEEKLNLSQKDRKSVV